MGLDKTYLVLQKEILTHGRLNKLTADRNIRQNLAQSITLSIVIGICPTLRLVPKILSNLVFKKITVTHFFGYFFSSFQLDNLYLVGKRRFQLMCFLYCSLFNKLRFQKIYWTIYLMSWTIISDFVQSVKTS